MNSVTALMTSRNTVTHTNALASDQILCKRERGKDAPPPGHPGRGAQHTLGLGSVLLCQLPPKVVLAKR
jgi:hypothetical protein